MSNTDELVTAAAQAADLLASALRQAQQSANKADRRLLEISLREPLSRACWLFVALSEIAEAVASDHAN